jgi:hypothetical protein
MKTLFFLVLTHFICGCGNNTDPGLPSFIDVSGRWEGSAKFTNNCVNPACSYQGNLNPPSIIMEITQTLNILEGTITLNLPNAMPLFSGADCNSLSGSIGISRAQSSVSGTQVTLTQSDFFGVWDLQISGTSGPQSSMQGTLTNTAPGCSGLISDNISLTRRN